MDKEQRVANVLLKRNCGATDDAHQKRKKAVIQTNMSHKLACSNITSLVTSADVRKHNIADDCQQWQDSLREYRDVLHQNDMITPFMIQPGLTSMAQQKSKVLTSIYLRTLIKSALRLPVAGRSIFCVVQLMLNLRVQFG